MKITAEIAALAIAGRMGRCRIVRRPPANWRQLTVEYFPGDEIPAIKSLVAKVARFGIRRFARLPLPMAGIFGAENVMVQGVSVRGISQYSIMRDETVMRLDVLGAR